MENNIEASLLSNKRKKMLKRAVFMCSFLILPIINFFVFYVYIHLDSFVMAFQQTTPSGGVEWTFNNFIRVFDLFSVNSERNLGVALRNTFLFYFVGVGINLPISLLMGYFIYKKIAGYKLFRVVTYLPTIIGAAAMVSLFKYTFSEGGVYHAITHFFGNTFTNPITNVNTSIYMMLIYSIAFGLGGNIVVWGGAMNGISPEMLEAGELDGCNWFQEFYLLIIPSIWPTVATVILLGTISFLGATGPVLLFTKGEYGTTTLGYMLFEMVGMVDGYESYKDYYLASALGLCMTAISFPLAMLVKKIVYSEKREV